MVSSAMVNGAIVVIMVSGVLGSWPSRFCDVVFISRAGRYHPLRNRNFVCGGGLSVKKAQLRHRGPRRGGAFRGAGRVRDRPGCASGRPGEFSGSQEVISSAIFDPRSITFDPPCPMSERLVFQRLYFQNRPGSHRLPSSKTVLSKTVLSKPAPVEEVPRLPSS